MMGVTPRGRGSMFIAIVSLLNVLRQKSVAILDILFQE